MRGKSTSKEEASRGGRFSFLPLYWESTSFGYPDPWFSDESGYLRLGECHSHDRPFWLKEKLAGLPVPFKLWFEPPPPAHLYYCLTIQGIPSISHTPHVLSSYLTQSDPAVNEYH